MPQTLTAARISTTKRTAKLELPECWAAASVSAAANALDRNSVSAKASRRRLVSKAYRIAEVSR